MALNWVMLPEAPTPTRPFVPLPNERTLFTSSPRTSLSLTTPKSTYPAHSANLSITSSDGTVHLTNQRLIYLPRPNSSITTNTAKFISFSCPLLNLHDTHLVVPWFGPNAWTALVQPVPGGNMYGTAPVELKLTFKEGGAPDFQTRFEAVKERLQQVVDLARERNSNTNSGNGTTSVDLSSVHLDQLPSYQDHNQDRLATAHVNANPTSTADADADTQDQEQESPAPTSATADEVRALAAAAATRRARNQSRRQSRDQAAAIADETPVDAPPGYEETQQRSVEDELARRLGRA